MKGRVLGVILVVMFLFLASPVAAVLEGEGEYALMGCIDTSQRDSSKGMEAERDFNTNTYPDGHPNAPGLRQVILNYVETSQCASGIEMSVFHPSYAVVRDRNHVSGGNGDGTAWGMLDDFDSCLFGAGSTPPEKYALGNYGSVPVEDPHYDDAYPYGTWDADNFFIFVSDDAYYEACNTANGEPDGAYDHDTAWYYFFMYVEDPFETEFSLMVDDDGWVNFYSFNPASNIWLGAHECGISHYYTSDKAWTSATCRFEPGWYFVEFTYNEDGGDNVFYLASEEENLEQYIGYMGWGVPGTNSEQSCQNPIDRGDYLAVEERELGEDRGVDYGEEYSTYRQVSWTGTTSTKTFSDNNNFCCGDQLEATILEGSFYPDGPHEFLGDEYRYIGDHICTINEDGRYEWLPVISREANEESYCSSVGGVTFPSLPEDLSEIDYDALSGADMCCGDDGGGMCIPKATITAETECSDLSWTQCLSEYGCTSNWGIWGSYSCSGDFDIEAYRSYCVNADPTTTIDFVGVTFPTCQWNGCDFVEASQDIGYLTADKRYYCNKNKATGELFNGDTFEQLQLPPSHKSAQNNENKEWRWWDAREYHVPFTTFTLPSSSATYSVDLVSNSKEWYSCALGVETPPTVAALGDSNIIKTDGGTFANAGLDTQFSCAQALNMMIEEKPELFANVNPFNNDATVSYFDPTKEFVTCSDDNNRYCCREVNGKTAGYEQGRFGPSNGNLPTNSCMSECLFFGGTLGNALSSGSTKLEFAKAFCEVFPYDDWCDFADHQSTNADDGSETDDIGDDEYRRKQNCDGAFALEGCLSEVIQTNVNCELIEGTVSDVEYEGIACPQNADAFVYCLDGEPVESADLGEAEVGTCCLVRAENRYTSSTICGEVNADSFDTEEAYETYCTETLNGDFLSPLQRNAGALCTGPGEDNVFGTEPPEGYGDLCCVGGRWEVPYEQIAYEEFTNSESYVCYEGASGGVFAECCTDFSRCNNRPVTSNGLSQFDDVAPEVSDNDYGFYGRGGVTHTIKNFDYWQDTTYVNGLEHKVSFNAFNPYIESIENGVYNNQKWHGFEAIEFDIAYNRDDPIIISIKDSLGTECTLGTVQEFVTNGASTYRWRKVVVPILCPDVTLDRFTITEFKLSTAYEGAGFEFYLDNVFLRANGAYGPALAVGDNVGPEGIRMDDLFEFQGSTLASNYRIREPIASQVADHDGDGEITVNDLLLGKGEDLYVLDDAIETGDEVWYGRTIRDEYRSLFKARDVIYSGTQLAELTLWGGAGLDFNSPVQASSNLDTIYPSVSNNYYCTGDFGTWIQQLDGPTNNKGWIDSEEEPSFEDKGPYELTCNEQRSFAWTGNACCGDDTANTYNPRGAQALGEYFADSERGCFAGNPVFDNWVVSDALNDPNFASLLFYEGEFYSCLDSEYTDYKVGYNGKTLTGKDLVPENNVMDEFSVIGTWVCQAGGSWADITKVKKTQLLASSLYAFSLNDDGTQQDFDLYCDTFESITPYSSAELIAPPNIFSAEAQQTITDSCVLRLDPQVDNKGDEKVIIGLGFGAGLHPELMLKGFQEHFASFDLVDLSLAEELDLTGGEGDDGDEGGDDTEPLDLADDAGFVKAFVESCNDIAEGGAASEFYELCDYKLSDLRMAYNKDFRLLLVTTVDNDNVDFDGFFDVDGSGFIGFTQEIWEGLTGRFFIWFGNGKKDGSNAEPGTILPALAESDAELKQIYLGKRGSRFIQGFIEEQNRNPEDIDTYITVEYVGFSNSMLPLAERYYNYDVLDFNGDALSDNYFVREVDGQIRQYIQLIDPDSHRDPNIYGKYAKKYEFEKLFDWTELTTQLEPTFVSLPELSGAPELGEVIVQAPYRHAGMFFELSTDYVAAGLDEDANYYACWLRENAGSSCTADITQGTRIQIPRGRGELTATQVIYTSYDEAGIVGTFSATMQYGTELTCDQIEAQYNPSFTIKRDDVACGFSRVAEDLQGTKPVCLFEKTYVEAKEACAAMGARLCTGEELLYGGVAEGTGCNHNTIQVWGAGTCTENRAFAFTTIDGDGSCLDQDTPIAVRCCADI